MPYQKYSTLLLRELASALTPSDEDLEKAVQRINSAAGLLNNSDFGMLDWEPIGSCVKRTAILPVEDMDLMVYLDPLQWLTQRGARYQPSVVIRMFAERFEIAKRLHIENGHITVRRQNSSIRLIYHKEGSTHIDIVPAFWMNENAHRVVEIPDRNGRQWIRSCPRRQLNLINKEDNRYHSLRRGIRLLKRWRDGHGLSTLKSYALELLASYCWRKGAPNSDVGTFRAVLDWMVSTGMRESVFIPDIISRYQLPARAAVVIMDVGVHSNNVAANIDASTRRVIVQTARYSLDTLARVDEQTIDRSAQKLFWDAMGRK